MNSDDLRIFVAVAEAKGVSRAAARLGLPKSSVSRQVTRLEAEAGAILFERGRGGVRLTDAGHALFDQAVRVGQLIEGAAASVQAALAAPRGVLRVNVPHLFATQFLAPRLPDFLRDCPEVELVIDVSHAPAGAMAPETDVVVRVGPLEDSALIARKLGVSELRLYAAPQALGRLSPRRAGALLAEAGLVEAVALGQYRSVVGFAGGRASRRVQVQEPLARMALVLAGAGAAWLPAFLCRDAVAQGRLVDLAPGDARGPIDLHALFPAHLAASPKVRAFIGFLAGAMGPLRG
ncbi:LysR family transcriptional regulator [Roseomonas fluvialis]|uniref:LysR family transcriptional regulator n=1 Tax=Roseomonas fluvialis TaxID=1750527 RepID=A0ABN6P3R7_9PROT|nr:LysR family transcriptional regulator [Roseomonas fluvialis]BDG73259.1 LysR family transcriptional regulator [Roseomonas fluvialis]